jgi:hypothetical protein
MKAKAIVLGAVLALLLVYSPMPSATLNPLQAGPPEGGGTEGGLTEVPSTPPDGVVGYYTRDGGKTWFPIPEQKGVAERIRPNMSKEEFMSIHGTPGGAALPMVSEAQ